MTEAQPYGPPVYGRALPVAGEDMIPPPPVVLTFDVHWMDPDRTPLYLAGIVGSERDGLILTLHGDKITHLVNLDVVSHVNIWEERGE